MILYLLVSAIAIWLASLSRDKKSNSMLALAFIILTIFLSLGYRWGNDVATYELWFDLFNSYNLFDFDSYETLSKQSEYGFILINQLCSGIGFCGMRAILFAIENLIIYQLIIRTVPRNYYWLAVFIYTVNPNFMILGSSMMRQWLAMCLIMLGFLFLGKRRWMVYLLLVLIASTIHRSALICMPLVVLPFIPFSFKKTYLIWLIPLIALYFIMSNYIVQYIVGWLMAEEMYTGYTGSANAIGVGIISIIHFLIYGFMILNIHHIEKDKQIYIAVLIGYGLILPLYNYSRLASRLNYYFIVFTIVAYPIFLMQLRIDKSLKRMLVLVIMILCLYANIQFFSNPMWFIHYGNYVSLFEAGVL